MSEMLYLPGVESMNIIVCNFCLRCARNHLHSLVFFSFQSENFRSIQSYYSFGLKKTTQFSESARLHLMTAFFAIESSNKVKIRMKFL